ncbi:4Fe-4S binding protein [Adlercreutzia sp. R25]|uniref:4Fe-4S binding protein n=1 Tax=Adlercreutzia shanghongiae TaxID=3111773 RepID=A0ABU6J1C1_9ACTN|nr:MULTISPECIES: 4Fe-4S binding protein [unclassified Adlercreutzia]MEC4273605.1 4Fe-4S binding protein [Adlercreutzia sp. R25]MEC4295931.1 4Fe-4S binding protein [Adlercreutzia sp. R22]
MVETIDAAAHAHVGAAFTAVESAAIRVHRERCAKVRNRNVDCLKCAAACTSGCISLEEGELSIDASKCVGCGTCATVCPTCALESLNPTDAQLKAACAAAVRDGEVVIACSQMEEALGNLAISESMAPVVCAGRVDESLLAGLAAEGVQRVTVLCGMCDRCAQRHGRNTAELVAATARTLLDAWGSSMDIVVTDEAPEGVLADGVSAEAARAACDVYFAEERACEPLPCHAERNAPEASASPVCHPEHSAAGAEPKDLPEAAEDTAAYAPAVPASLSSPEAEAADSTAGPGMRFYWNSGHTRKVAAHSMHVMKDGTLPHFLPDRRERLLDALARIGEPTEGKLESRLWGAVVIDGTKCVSCRMCATFCPTGAIAKFDEADGAMGVTHAPADCVKCGSCQDVCPADAITLLDAVPTTWLSDGSHHRYAMTPRPVSLVDNPHQILDTFRLDFNGDIFER